MRAALAWVALALLGACASTPPAPAARPWQIVRFHYGSAAIGADFDRILAVVASVAEHARAPLLVIGQAGPEEPAPDALARARAAAVVAALRARAPGAALDVRAVGARAAHDPGLDALVAIHLPDGVAPPPDGDGDGIPDDADQCPNEQELWDDCADFDGCPDPWCDEDGDGVEMDDDYCPTRAGPPPDGCPSP